MRAVFILILIAATLTSSSQRSVIQMRENIVRYNSSITPLRLCLNNNCTFYFLNVNMDTLAGIYEDGLIDIRVNVNVKDTLTILTIIEPTGTISATRTLFNGRSAVSFNQDNYYILSDNGGLPINVYKKVTIAYM